jgi:cell division protein FtsQ
MSVWIRRLSFYVSLAALLVVISTCVLGTRDPARFPLKVLEVSPAPEHCVESEIQATATPFLAQGFFALEVRALRDALEHLPWVKHVDVRRVWPDKVRLTVEEQVAQARWGDKGVLSTEGLIFYPAAQTIAATLPTFVGPEDQAKEMLERYLSLLTYLAPLGLRVQTLDCLTPNVWQVVLNNQMAIIMGKSSFEESMNRFVLAYQHSLGAKHAQIARVDLRYSNGLAVAWKTGGSEKS